MKHWRRARTMLTSTALALGLAGAATACGGDGGADPNCPKFSQVTIWAKCLPCHSSAKKTAAERMDATIGVDYDVYESAKAHGPTAALWASTNLMPPAPMPQATDAEKASLQAWVDCGMPQ